MKSQNQFYLNPILRIVNPTQRGIIFYWTGLSGKKGITPNNEIIGLLNNSYIDHPEFQ